MTFSPTDPISFQQVALQRLKVGTRAALSAEFATLASTVEIEAIVDHLRQDLVFALKAHVLAEQLPPQTIGHRVRVDADDPRFASWWDHFKATHQNRWWMRWRTWPIAYTKTKVTVERVVEVTVRDNWTYPRAAIALPKEWGRPVYVATWTASDFSWRDW